MQRLHVLRESPEVFTFTASAYKEDTKAALADLLARAGFTTCQAEKLQRHRIRRPLMSEEDAVRQKLDACWTS